MGDPRIVKTFSMYYSTEKKLLDMIDRENINASRFVEQLILDKFALLAIEESMTQVTLHRTTEKQRKQTQDQIIRGLLKRSKLQAVNEVRAIEGGICNPRIKGSCEICESIIKYEHDWRDGNKFTMWGSGYFEKLD